MDRSHIEPVTVAPRSLAMISLSAILFAAVVATAVVRWINAGEGGGFDGNRPAGA